MWDEKEKVIIDLTWTIIAISSNIILFKAIVAKIGDHQAILLILFLLYSIRSGKLVSTL